MQVARLQCQLLLLLRSLEAVLLLGCAQMSLNRAQCLRFLKLLLDYRTPIDNIDHSLVFPMSQQHTTLIATCSGE